MDVLEQVTLTIKGSLPPAVVQGMRGNQNLEPSKLHASIAGMAYRRGGTELRPITGTQVRYTI